MFAKKEKKKITKKKTLLDKYKALCYRVVGRRLRRLGHEYFSRQLKEANFKYSPGLYISVLICTTILATVVGFVVFSVVFLSLQALEAWLYSTTLTTLTASAVLVFFFLSIQLKISSRRTQIDRDLPFVLSELSILASTGIPPIELIRRAAIRRGGGSIATEFKKMVYKIDIEGKDIITAMSEVAQETPSTAFRETLWEISNMIHQGGNLDQNLRNKADQTLQLKRDIQKEFIERLMLYADGYVTTILVGALFVGIGAILINMVGGSLGPFDAESIMIFLAYGIIPLAVFIFGILVSMAYSKTD
jgi:flagellar protein FlaJ